MKIKKSYAGHLIYLMSAFILLFIAWIYLRVGVSYLYRYGNHKRVFGATYMTMNNEFYTIVNEEIKKRVEANGDRLLTLDPALDQAKQLQQIEYLIDQKVEAIFLNPVNWMDVKPGLEKAKAAGIPVIVVDAPVYEEELVTTTILSDNYQAGVLCAMHLMSSTDKANILLLTHEEAKSAVDRIRGFTDTIKGNDNYQILVQIDTQGQTERTLPKVEECLGKYVNLQAIMSINDPTALGALAAIDHVGYANDVLVYGVDGSPDGKRLIKEGMLAATVYQSPKNMGRIAAETVYTIIRGETVDKEIVLPVKMIDQQNIENYDISIWQ